MSAQHTPGPVTMWEPPDFPCQETRNAWTGNWSCERGCQSPHACLARRNAHDALEAQRAAIAKATGGAA